MRDRWAGWKISSTPQFGEIEVTRSKITIVVLNTSFSADYSKVVDDVHTCTACRSKDAFS